MQRVITVDDLIVTIKYRRKMKNIYLKVEKGNSPQNLDKFWRAIYYEINR